MLYDPATTLSPEGFQPVADQQQPSTTSVLLSILRSIAVPQVVQVAQAVSPPGFIRRAVGDPALSLARGVVGLPEAVVGLADIPTFGYAGKILEAGGYGFQPKLTKEYISVLDSPEKKAALEKVRQAKGFFNTAEAMIENPSTIVGTVLESLPSMIGGAGVARKALTSIPRLAAIMTAGRAAGATAAQQAAANTAAVLAGAASEGVITAGQTAEQLRQESPSGLLTAKQSALSLTSGAATGLIGVLGGKLASRLGIADIDAIIAGGRASGTVAERIAAKGVLRRVVESAISESALEELPQSAQEQIQQNFASDRPPMDGVAEAAASGLLAGLVMGGAGGVLGNTIDTSSPTQPPPIPKESNAPNPIQQQVSDFNQYPNANERIQTDRQNRDIASTVPESRTSPGGSDSRTSVQGQPTQEAPQGAPGITIPPLQTYLEQVKGLSPASPEVDLLNAITEHQTMVQNAVVNGVAVPDEVMVPYSEIIAYPDSKVDNIQTDGDRFVSDLREVTSGGVKVKENNTGSVTLQFPIKDEAIVSRLLAQYGIKVRNNGYSKDFKLSEWELQPGGTGKQLLPVEKRLSEALRARPEAEKNTAIIEKKSKDLRTILDAERLQAFQKSRGISDPNNPDIRQSISTATTTGVTRNQAQSVVNTVKLPKSTPAIHVIDSVEAETLGNAGSEGFTHNGEIYLVHDLISDGKTVSEVLNEEVAHIALDNPAAQFEIDAIGGDYITEENRQWIRDQGYEQGQNETSDMWVRRQNEEFIAKQELGNTPWWKDFVQRLVEWFKKKFDLKLTGDEAIRAYKRKWLNRMDESLGTSSRQSLATSKAEAINIAKLVRGQDERKIKAAHLLAQGEVATMLDKHGAAAADPAVKEILRYQEYSGIKETGRSINNGVVQDYRTLKAGMAGNVYQLRHLALIAATQWQLAKNTMQSAVDEGVKAAKEIASKSFGNTLARLAKADAALAASDYAYTLSGAVFDSAMSEAATALKDEKLNDLQTAQLEGQLKELQASKDSRFAIGQIMDDMVKAISNFKDGYNLLNDPAYGDASAIKAAYVDFKSINSDPMHDDKLVNWAARMLARSSSLRQKVLAAQLSKDSNVRSTLGSYAASLASDLEKNPAAAVRKWRAEAVKLATTKQKAAFIYRQLHAEVSDAMDRFTVQDDAAQIAQAWLNDPDRQALVAEIRSDALIDANKPSVLPLVGKEMMLPSGKALDLGVKTGDALKLSSKRQEIRDAANEIETFLENNPLDENYGQHARNFQTLMEFYAGSKLMNPQGDRKFFNRGFGILRQAANLANSVVGEQLRKALTLHDKFYNMAVRWRTGYGPKFTINRVAALRSHGFKWGVFFGNTMEEANQQWIRRIGNELASGHSNGEMPFKVGDLIGQHGDVVTKEDMADLEAQSNARTSGYELIGDKQITERSLGGVVMFGRALKTQKIMVSRMFDNSAVELAAEFVALQKQHIEAVKSGDQNAAAATKKALFDFFEANFSFLGYQFVADRSDQFAVAGPFDGEGRAFQQAVQRMKSNPKAITSFDQLYDYLSERSLFSKEATMEWVLNEYGRIITQFDKQFKNDTTTDGVIGRSDETKNNFTRSRNDQFAPFGFYRNGFQTSDDVMNFAAGMASRSHDSVAAGLQGVLDDIDRQISALKKAEGVVGRSEAMRRQALDLHNAKNYDDYRALESRRAKVQGMLENFKGNRQLTDIDNVLSRSIGALSGSLMSSFTTVKNYTTGPFYLGRVFNQTMASYWRSYPMALWNVWVNNGLFKFGLSAAYGIPKAFTFDLLYGVGEGLYGLTNPATRSAGHFASKAMGRVLDELGTNIYMRVKDYRERVASGDQVHNDHRADYDARVFGAWLTNGHIHGEPMTGMEKALVTPAALIEISINAINRTLNPTLGDATINSGASTFIKSSAGPIAMHEDALRRIFRDWKKGGYRVFDFADPGSELNTITHKEMFPNILRDPLSLRFINGREDMTNMLRFYKDAGIDFHVKAAEFLRELNNGNQKATLLTNEEIDAMVS